MMGHNKEHIKFLDTNAECRVHVCAVESVADVICEAVPSNIEKSVKNRAALVNRISPAGANRTKGEIYIKNSDNSDSNAKKRNTLSRGKFKFKKVIKCVYNKLDTQVRCFAKLVTVKERKKVESNNSDDVKLMIKVAEANETLQDDSNAALKSIDEKKFNQDVEVDTPEDENVEKKVDSIAVMKKFPFRFTKF